MNDDLRALVQRLRAIASEDGPNDSDIERDCTLGAAALESLLARVEAEHRYSIACERERDEAMRRAEAAECTVRLLTPDASRWRMARNDPQWLGFDHDMLPEQVDAAADRELPERAANYRGGQA